MSFLSLYHASRREWLIVNETHSGVLRWTKAFSLDCLADTDQKKAMVRNIHFRTLGTALQRYELKEKQINNGPTMFNWSTIKRQT